jgi:hypothetical protein
VEIGYKVQEPDTPLAGRLAGFLVSYFALEFFVGFGLREEVSAPALGGLIQVQARGDWGRVIRVFFFVREKVHSRLRGLG